MSGSHAESVINNLEDKRQQLEKQFYKVYKNLLLISQLFLSAPMGLQRPKRNMQCNDVISNGVHIVWCMCVYIWLAYCIYFECIHSLIELPAVQKPLYFSEYFVYLIHLLECIRMVYFRRETFWYFQRFILNFDTKLIKMEVRVYYSDLNKFIIRHLLLILFNVTVCLAICYFYAYGKAARFFSYITVYVLPNVVINISLLHYYALLYFVYNRGDKLYSHLNRLLNTSNCNDIFKFRQELNLIRSMFAKVDRFTKKINDHNSISICLAIFGLFANISVNIFLLYKYFNSWLKTKTIWIIFSLTWILMNIAKLVLIVYYNQKVQNMKIRATLLLTSFTSEYPGAETTFRLFILQLMSETRSNYICGGLLVLDMKFITSVAVAITTLFIFLVQYDITFDALMGTYKSHRER